jgi:hypothetical protein
MAEEGTFDDYAAAFKARDVIRGIIREEIARVVPQYRYATVTSINYSTNRAQVQFPEGGSPVSVGMGAIQPSVVGQIVRVNGLPGDRFIEDVYGPPHLRT